MEGPYITRGAYLYGNTFYEQEVPGYNSIKHHHPPADFMRRGLAAYRVFDDGSQYVTDDSNSDGNIIRGEVPTVTNIETMIEKTLKVYIYGVTEDQDKVYSLELGKRYAITYISELGVRAADGYLRYFSTSIPEDCTKWIGSYSSTSAQAFIGMDCSSKGVSDKRKIYIANIRAIEALNDDEDYVAPTEDDETKKYSILERLEEILEALEANGCDCCEEVAEKIDLIDIKVNEIQNSVIYDEAITVEEIDSST